MVLRRKLTVLLATVMMVMMSAAPVMADGHDEGHKRDDGLDKNKGGGQEKPKNENRKNGQFERVVVASNLS